MANEINIALDPISQTGLTVSAKLYSAGALTTTISLTESPASSGFYTGAATGVAAGDYSILFINATTGAQVGSGRLEWDGTAERKFGAAKLASDGLDSVSKFAGITSLRAWLGALAGKTADAGTLAEIQATTAGASYDNTTDSNQAIRDRGDAAWTTGASAGTGARTVTVTVNDGTDPLENAIVRMTEGANTYTETTNVSGVAVFALDDATYTVGIAKAGYSFTPTTLVVDGTEAQTYSMSAITVTPASDPDLSTGYLTAYDEEGQPEEGVLIYLQMVRGVSTDGRAFDNSIRTGISAANGLVEFPGLIRSAKYEVWRGETGDRRRFTVADATTTAIEEVLGHEGT